MKKEASHVVEQQLGGRKRLPVLRPVDDELSDELRRERVLYGPRQKDPALKRALPANRSECPRARPCPYFCKHNTWVVSPLNQPGRRWVKPVSQLADEDGPSTQVRPSSDYNCTLDYAEHVHDTQEQFETWVIADALGVTERQVRRYAESAMAALPSRLRQALERDDERAVAVSLLKELMA